MDVFQAVACIPLWFVSSVIDRFASSWGVPLLSSFCSDPAFLVPFVSSQGGVQFFFFLQIVREPKNFHFCIKQLVLVASSPSSPLRMTTVYQLNSFPSGNRLLSLSSPSSQSSLSSIGGVGWVVDKARAARTPCSLFMYLVYGFRAQSRAKIKRNNVTNKTLGGHFLLIYYQTSSLTIFDVEVENYVQPEFYFECASCSPLQWYTALLSTSNAVTVSDYVNRHLWALCGVHEYLPPFALQKGSKSSGFTLTQCCAKFAQKRFEKKKFLHLEIAHRCGIQRAQIIEVRKLNNETTRVTNLCACHLGILTVAVVECEHPRVICAFFERLYT